MQHLLDQNTSLIVCKQVKAGPEWRHVIAGDEIVESTALSNRTSEISYVFPLNALSAVGRQENLSPDFRAFLDARYAHHYAPEEVLGYIYAVLHAPSYRSRYADFLRIDFPRIPFAQKRKHFDALSALGWALVQAHLLRDCPHRGLAQYAGKGDHSVEAVAWGETDQRIHINKTQSFGPVPEAVWRFTIGGYQVLDKYLKSRKGRRLSLDEINHLGQVADSLAFTIDQMALIDKAWAQAFPDRG
jgi:predicted helicase